MDNIVIRIPVFKTETVAEELQLFNIDREEMVDTACKRINDYGCSTTNKIIITNDFKNFTHEVVHIEASKEYINGSPCVFMKLSAHKTNMRDGYIEAPEEAGKELITKKIPLTQQVKIGSEHYYLILYPTVLKKKRNKYCRYWLVFLYDDPNKNTQDFIKITKKVILEILKTKPSHLKPMEFVEEIQKAQSYTMSACFQSSETMSNDMFDKRFSNRFVSGRVANKKFFDLKDLNPKEVQDILNTDDDPSVFRKVFHIFNGKKSYKIRKERKVEIGKAAADFKLYIESNYNYSTEITEEELTSNKIYEKEFILKKMEPIITNCLS